MQIMKIIQNSLLKRIGKVFRDKARVKKKVCFACSSGGHFDEMIQIYMKMKETDSFIITERAAQLQRKDDSKIYYMINMNRRDILCVIKLLGVMIRSFFILKKEKPTHIISFGSMITWPICFIGKLMNIKIIYVESIARVNSASLTGRLIYPFADLFIVQWEGLLQFYPKAKYGGWIY